MEKKKTKIKVEEKVECKDRLCPVHGDKKLKIRGRTFEGKVIRKFPGRVVIEFERIVKIPKYERYEKRKTKIHARLPDCMEKEIGEGDLILVGETRPISKTIHFIIDKVIRKREEKA
ncbi:MAG: 30S ribosomal protein S17 [Candidatus Pacearchaeota archaeon]